MKFDSNISIGAKLQDQIQLWLGPAADPLASLGTMRVKIPRKLAGYIVSKRIIARNERPLVSFTFDDVPATTFIHGAPVLEDYDVRGTFYVAGGLCDKTDDGRHIIAASECIALHRRGHEIGCHTFSHAQLLSLNAKVLSAEIDDNKAFFAALAPDLALENFAYPFGSISIPRKLQVQQQFHSCRGVREGINLGTVDLGMLKAMAMDHTTSRAKIAEAIDESYRSKGWLILYTHDVAPTPTAIGCKPDFLSAAIKHALASGCEVVTIREGLRRIGFHQSN